MKFLTQRQFALQVGITTTTLGHWIEKGFLEPNHITPSGRKYFTQEQLDEFIKKMESNSFEGR